MEGDTCWVNVTPGKLYQNWNPSPSPLTAGQDQPRSEIRDRFRILRCGHTLQSTQPALTNIKRRPPLPADTDKPWEWEAFLTTQPCRDSHLARAWSAIGYSAGPFCGKTIMMKQAPLGYGNSSCRATPQPCALPLCREGPKVRISSVVNPS